MLVLGIVIVCGATGFVVFKNLEKNNILSNSVKKIDTAQNKEEQDKKEEEDTTQKEESTPSKEEVKPNKEELLSEYEETVHPDEYDSKTYKLDTAHIKVLEETANAKETIKRYTITLNGVAKELAVVYKAQGNKILFQMMLNNKLVHDEVYYEESEAIEDISMYLKNSAFKPEDMTIFKGKDGKEYVLLEREKYDYTGTLVNAYILNDNFEKLSVQLGEKEVNEFIVSDASGKLLNLEQYSTSIGFKTRKEKEEEPGVRYLTIANGKIKYFDIISECNRGSATLYEISIDNNKMIAKKVDDFEIFVVTESSC